MIIYVISHHCFRFDYFLQGFNLFVLSFSLFFIVFLLFLLDKLLNIFPDRKGYIFFSLL